MIGIENYGLFVMSSFLLAVSPGPDTMLIMGRASTHGVKGGVAAGAGIAIGCFVHITAATVGLSALLTASATAFMIVKLAGAVFLIYLGIQMLASRSSAHVTASRTAKPISTYAIARQGFLTNALNPKVAIFFLAFVPQFIAADAPMKAYAFLLLGITFNVVGTAWNMVTAVSSGLLMNSNRFRRAQTWVNRAVGAILIAFGAKLAADS
jgi:threonine/homoserine/homoserine lactone efflux protein